MSGPTGGDTMMKKEPLYYVVRLGKRRGAGAYVGSEATIAPGLTVAIASVTDDRSKARRFQLLALADAYAVAFKGRVVAVRAREVKP